MREHASPWVFEIAFLVSPPLREVVRADPHLPLPAIPVAEAPPPPPPSPDPAQAIRQEQQAIEQVLAQLRAAADRLGKGYDALVADMRQAAVELAMAVASRLTFDKLQAGDFPIEEMVSQAVALLPACPAVRVFLHPEDLALLRRRLGDQGLSASGTPEVRFEPDTALGRGACRAEAGEIHVLSDLAGQLAELRRHLIWSVSDARSGPGTAAP